MGTDLRVRRTKYAIKQAFYTLLEEKPFEKITISDIAKEAMINRGTFYLHYQDKYDLLQSLENGLIDELDQYAKEITRESIEECRKQNKPFPHVISILSYVEQYPAFFQMISQSNEGIAFFQKIGDRTNDKIIELYPFLKDNKIYNKYGKVMATAVFGSIVNQWIQEGMTDSKEEIAMLITKTIFANMDYYNNDAEIKAS